MESFCRPRTTGPLPIYSRLVVRVVDVVVSLARRHGPAVMSIGLAAAAAGNAASYPSGPRGLAGAVSALTAGALLLRDRSRLAMALAVAAGFAVLAGLGIGETPMWAFIELLLVSFWTAEGLAGRQRTAALAALLLIGIWFDARSGDGGLAGSIVSPAVIIGAPAIAGLLLRRSRHQTETLARLSRELAEERDRAAAAAELGERTRIAREIHDVVAHTVGVMLVQAAAAEELIGDRHPAAQPISAIRSTGKQAIAELRRVVGVLRDATGERISPQPSLADLHNLVVGARTSGMTVHVDWRDDLDDLSAGQQLTVYRVVQEALTNARKHAPGAVVRITIQRDPHGLDVRIDDDGAGAPAGGLAGFGLVGLRERAELYDGALCCGPRPGDGGWQVQLRLPVEARRTSATPAAS